MPLLDTLSKRHGVGPVCHEPDIAPSAWYRHQLHRHYPDTRSQRDRRDDQLKQEIQRVYDENYVSVTFRPSVQQTPVTGNSVHHFLMDTIT